MHRVRGEDRIMSGIRDRVMFIIRDIVGWRSEARDRVISGSGRGSQCHQRGGHQVRLDSEVAIRHCRERVREMSRVRESDIVTFSNEGQISGQAQGEMGSKFIMGRVILGVRSQGSCSFRRQRQVQLKVRGWGQEGVRLGRKRVEF